MKRISFILALCLSLFSMSVYSQTDAVFVYRNDGDLDAFLLSDIVQMTQSKEDTLGVLHEDFCVQEILTSDTLYRIPISAIDSIGFHPLPTEYQPEVIFANTIEEFESWIIQTSDSTILLYKNTPVGLIPEIGKILYEPSETSMFPNGFCGRLINKTIETSGILLEFETPQITDVFKTLQIVAHGTIQNDNDNGANTRSITTDDVVNFILPDELVLNAGPCSLSLNPDVHVYSYVVIKDGELSMKNGLKGHFEGTVGMSLSSPDDSPLKYEPDLLWLIGKVPIGPSGLFLRLGFSMFLKAELSGEITAELPFSFDGDISMTRVKNKMPQINHNFTKPSSDFNYNMSINVNGSISSGPAIQFGLEWAGNYAVAICEVGPKLQASLNIHSDGAVENNLYAAIKDTKVEGSIETDVYLSFHKAFYKDNKNFNSPHLTSEYSIASIYVLPEFNNLTWEETAPGVGHLNGSIERETPLGTTIGWALYTQQDELYDSEMFPQTYRFPNSWDNDGMYKEYGLTPGYKYIAYPIVRFAGVLMRVNQSVEVALTPTVLTRGYENNGPQSTTVYGFCYYNAGSYLTVPNVGFAYSADGVNWSHVASTNLGVDGVFSATLNDIDCITNYKYKTYVERDGIKYYGEELSFTSDPPLMDGTWQVVQGDGESYTVTFNNGECTWSRTVEKPGSYSFDPNGRFIFGVFDYWWVGFGTNWSVYNFSGTLNDKNHPTMIIGNVVHNEGNEFADHDTLETSFTATKQ